MPAQTAFYSGARGAINCQVAVVRARPYARLRMWPRPWTTQRPARRFYLSALRPSAELRVDNREPENARNVIFAS
jgi:hypothetical protein